MPVVDKLVINFMSHREQVWRSIRVRTSTDDYWVMSWSQVRGVDPLRTGGRVPPKFGLGGHQLHCPSPKVAWRYRPCGTCPTIPNIRYIILLQICVALMHNNLRQL